MLLNEAEKIAEVLDIKDEEFCDFFFAREKKSPCKKLCCTCKRWERFYLRPHAGQFMKASYGLCVKPGQIGVREDSEVCEQYQCQE